MRMMMRIAVATAGLIVAGAVFGTIAGAVMLALWIAAIGAFVAPVDDLAFVLTFGLVYGGQLGAVLGPIAAWLLMRHVPLGIAVGGTTLGTLASGGIGLIVGGNPLVGMLWGMAGFGISAIALRLRYPPHTTHLLQQ
jgi:hypothetical protein